MSSETPSERLARAYDPTGDLIAGVREDQWTAPTPCTGWDVRALVNHLVFGVRLFTGILRGEQLQTLTEARGTDQLGDDPTGAYRVAVAELREAFDQPGILQQLFQAPIGTVPGAVLLHLRVTEALVHGWDLAAATGQPPTLPEELAEEELAFSREQLGPQVPRATSFGPEQPVAEDAPASTRLAAFLGRPAGSEPAPPPSS